MGQTSKGRIDAKRSGSGKEQLYGMKHSHPVLAARMALELTRIEFQAHDLLPGLHGIIVRARKFPGWPVPALQLGGRRLQGILAIADQLDRLEPSTLDGQKGEESGWDKTG